MKAEIHIGSVKVPLLDYAVSCTAILGIRDSGKTVTAKGIAEQLLEHDIPIIVFDAVGKWRWMKVPGEGCRSKGYKVVVAGGRAPDLSLSPQSVGEIVRSAVKEKIPLIIDLYDPKLSKADWRRIVQQSIRIIHYEANGVAHVFLEEAAEFIPQKVVDGETYAEVEKLARMGGNASVGITLINQRSQEVNKAVLDLAHNLVLGCQIGNRAIEAVEKWVDRLSPDTAKAVTTSLPHLKSGEAWVWTRSNPDDPSLEKLPMCRSLHPDRRTPDVVLKSAKAIDPDEFVQRLNVAIPKLIEEAKANDPTALKKRIAELERQVKAPTKAAPSPEPEKIYAVRDEDTDTVRDAVHKCENATASCQDIADKISGLVTSIGGSRNELCKVLDRLNQIKTGHHRITAGVALTANRPKLVERRTESRPAHVDGASLGKCERAILATLARHDGGCSIGKLALLSGYTQSGSFKNCLSALRTAGLIEGENTTVMCITDEGRSHGPFESLPNDLAVYWLSFPHFGKCERAILGALIENPAGLNLDELCDATRYEKPASGSFKNCLSALRTAGVVIGRNSDTMRASDDFFQ